MTGDYDRMTSQQEAAVWRQAAREFRQQADSWRGAWYWMLAVALLSNAAWAAAWWLVR